MNMWCLYLFSFITSPAMMHNDGAVYHQDAIYHFLLSWFKKRRSRLWWWFSLSIFLWDTVPCYERTRNVTCGVKVSSLWLYQYQQTRWKATYGVWLLPTKLTTTFPCVFLPQRLVLSMSAGEPSCLRSQLCLQMKCLCLSVAMVTVFGAPPSSLSGVDPHL